MILGNPSKKTKCKANGIAGDVIIIEDNKTFMPMLKAMRIYQWIKNFLIFLPLLLAHQVGDGLRLTNATLAFVSFALASSSIYMINDLIDLDADRKHSWKKNRPFANGTLSIKTGLLAVFILLFISIIISINLPHGFVYYLLTYVLSVLIYSFFIKKLFLLDVVFLSFFYTLRLLAGGAVTDVFVSKWLLLFLIPSFLMLALIKRYLELYNLDDEIILARGYTKNDMNMVMVLAVSIGSVSFVFYAFYLASNNVRLLYSRPDLLWITYPLVVYFASRICILSRRGKIPDNLLLYLLNDSSTYFVGAAIMLNILLAV